MVLLNIEGFGELDLTNSIPQYVDVARLSAHGPQLHPGDSWRSRRSNWPNGLRTVCQYAVARGRPSYYGPP